jgi:hypothetical protein
VPFTPFCKEFIIEIFDSLYYNHSRENRKKYTVNRNTGFLQFNNSLQWVNMMLVNEKYPYLKIFFDTMDRVHVISYTTASISGHTMLQTIGDGLIDFAELDLSEFQAKIKEATGGRPVAPESAAYTYQQLRNLIFDIAELLKGKHPYLYFFLVGKLNNILLEPIVSDNLTDILSEELPEFWRQLNDCFDALMEVTELQIFCKDAISFCLDSDNLIGHSAAERYIGFIYKYPAMNQLVFQIGLAMMPMRDGKLDFDQVREINKENVQTTKEMLEHIQGGQKGVNFLGYYRIESLEEMLLFELSEMLKHGYIAKRCRACGKYFIQLDNRKKFYCGRVDESGHTCRQRGSKRAYLEQVGGDPYLKKYKRMYERIYSRCYRAYEKIPEELVGLDMYRPDFKEWSRAATDVRQEYLDGKISGEEMLKRINPDKE